MGSRSRKTLILAAGTGSQAILTQVAVNLILVRILESQALFGIYRQIWLVVNTAIPLFGFGIDLSLYYFWSRVPAPERRAFLMRCLGVLSVSGIVLAAGIYTFAEPLARTFSVPESAELFRAICPYILIGLPVTLLYNFLVADDRPVRAALTNLISLLIQAGLTVGMLAAGYSLLTLFQVLGGFVFCRAGYAVFEILRFTRGSLRTPVSIPLRSQLKWAIPTGISTQISMIGSRLDKFVVAAFLDPAAYALYSVGALEFPLISLLWVAATTVMRIQIAGLYHAGNLAAIHAFYLTAFRKLCLTLIPAAALLMIFAEDLTVLLYSEQYREAAGIFRIYLVLTLFRIMPFDAVLSSIGRTRLVLVGGGLFLAFDLLLCLAMVKPFGLYGPPWATVIASASVTAFLGLCTSRALRVGILDLARVPGLGRIGASALLAGLLALPVTWLDWSPALSLLLGGVAYGLGYGALCLATRALSREELRELLRGLLPGKRSG